VDADGISRALTAENGIALPAIRAQFGNGVFYEDGTLNRPALAQIVFASPEYRRALEGITHPLVQQQMLDEIEAAGAMGTKVVILDVPLLFETGMDALCDTTIVISADIEERIRRVMSRDGLSREEAEARFASQMTDEERCARATRVVCNNQSMDKFKNELTAVYNQLLRAGK